MTDSFDDYGKPAENLPKIRNQPIPPNRDAFEDYPVTVNTIHQTQEEEKRPCKAPTPSQEQLHLNRDENDVPDESLGDLLAELDQLIGLKRVKFEVRRMIQFVKIRNLRQVEGISKSPISLHSVYYGNPGTGKTTIARLYGRMLKAMGLLSNGHLVETDRAGLVGSYVGQTTNKTDEKIKEALGGVLFIDEAYALSKGEDIQWDYGSESIEILVKRMEDYREDLVVIMAGYPEPMEKLLHSNEGLRSRFSTYIHFDDYSPDEMLEIFKLFCIQENYEIDPGALETVAGNLNYHFSRKDSSFGNARYVRNLFELIIRNQAYRIGTTVDNPSIQDLKQILQDDVPFLSDADME